MELLELLLAYLSSLQAPLLDGFLMHWPPAALVQAAPAAPQLAVLRCLPAMVANAPRATAALAARIQCDAPLLHWRQTYRRGELEANFFDNYAWSELIPASPAGDHQQMKCGVLMLGPNTLYPQHRHEAEEFYIPLSGTARWQQGDALWRSHTPGSVIHHASHEAHAMHTDIEPLLALYLWRGHDVSQAARLDRI